MDASDYKALFTSEAGEILQSLEAGVMALESGADRDACIEDLFRQAHNLKGMSGAMGYDHVVEASHALENLLDWFRKGELTITDAEVDLLLRSIDMLGELVRGTIAGGGGDFNDLLGTAIELEADSIGGLFVELAGHIPEPGESIEVGPLLRLREFKSLLTDRLLVFDEEKEDYHTEATPYDRGSTDAAYILRAMMFFEAAGGKSYTGLSNRYQGFVDLTDALKTDRAVLIGRARTGSPPHGATLWCNGAPMPESQVRRTTYYRFVLPVEKEGSRDQDTRPDQSLRRAAGHQQPDPRPGRRRPVRVHRPERVG